MELEDKLKIIAFELACKTTFENSDPEKLPELLEWVGETGDTELPKGFVLLPTYGNIGSNGAKVREVVNHMVKMLYGMLLTGALVAAEHGEAEHLTTGELVELIDSI